MHAKPKIHQKSCLVVLILTCVICVSSNTNEGKIVNPKTSYDTKVMKLRFEKWMNDNNKEYKDVKESEERFRIYQSNVEFIDYINSQNLSYTLIDNKFADMTHDEFKSKFTGRFTGIVPSGSHDDANDTSYDYQAIPATVDWRKQGAVTAIKHQGQCGSCWAFTTIASVEAVHKIKTGKLISLSEQQLIDCDRVGSNRGCNGGWMEGGFNYIKTKGIALEKDYPYTGKNGACNKAKAQKKAVTITGYKLVPRNNEKALQAAVAKQPVAVGLHSNLMLQLYKQGIFDGFCGTSLNHGGTIIGYGAQSGKKYWLVKNSWGTNWGERGFVRMRRNVASRSGLCGLAKQPSYPT